jgi:hypothetical protein
MEENEVKLQSPYFEIEYLDDNNIKHFGTVQDERGLEFMKERFTVLIDRKINA